MKNHSKIKKTEKKSVPKKTKKTRFSRLRKVFSYIPLILRGIIYKIKNRQPPPAISPRSKLATFLFCIFTGIIGGHRFYVRRYFSAFLMAATFGFCFIGIFVDLWNIRHNRFTDWRHSPVVNIRTKDDHIAVICSVLSIVAAWYVYPAAIVLFTQLSVSFGNKIGLLDESDVINTHAFLERLISKHGEVNTDITPPPLVIQESLNQEDSKDAASKADTE